MPLHIEQLRKRFVAPDGTALPVVDVDALTLEDGQHVALIGTSGSGKTTLLHLLAGILAPDEGRVVYAYDGRTTELTHLSEAERDVFRGANVGYIFQTHHLLPGLTALENVLMGMSFTGRRADPEWARHLLTEVGLSDRLHYKPQKLSVGQQQRVAVARALANRPRLVLADEPTGALDPTNAQQVLQLIRNLCTEVKATLLLVSHDLQLTSQFPRVLRLSEINRASAPALATRNS